MARFFLCCACGRKNLAKLLVVGWPSFKVIFLFLRFTVFFIFFEKGKTIFNRVGKQALLQFLACAVGLCELQMCLLLGWIYSLYQEFSKFIVSLLGCLSIGRSSMSTLTGISDAKPAIKQLPTGNTGIDSNESLSR